MIYLLDTNTCINYLNGRSDNIRYQLELINPEEIVLCSVVKAELFYGALKSGKPTENLNKVHHFASHFISLPFDDLASEEYGIIRSNLEKKGTPIGPNDLFIAAISIANKAILVTHNTREFKNVEGLQVEDWEI